MLTRGLNDKNEEVKRTCCQIVDNMCKLVEDPAEVLPLMPRLEPLVKNATEKISDPEARGVAEKAYKTLQKAAGEGAESLQQISMEKAKQQVEEALGDKKGSGDVYEAELAHVSGLAACAANMRVFDESAWKKDVGYLAPFDSIMEQLRAKMEVAAKPKEEVEEEDTEGVDLYKGAFSLAYGTLTLLRDAKMHLKRDRFYGLLGPNQCGKTTLMRAIANEQLEGFPKRDELKSVFVEHEIEDEEVGVQDDGFPILSVDKPGWWWVVHTCNDIYKLEPPVKEETVKELMKSIGFGYPGGPDRAANLELPVTSYSGGWKMKMQLCAAQLMNADVLMLDEPTGHLDVDNIKWLEDWLESFPGSIICTSHFSPFLDKMCTHIIDFQDRKLKTFKGIKGTCLTQFVEKYPETWFCLKMLVIFPPRDFVSTKYDVIIAIHPGGCWSKLKGLYIYIYRFFQLQKACYRGILHDFPAELAIPRRRRPTSRSATRRWSSSSPSRVHWKVSRAEVRPGPWVVETSGYGSKKGTPKSLLVKGKID